MVRAASYPLDDPDLFSFQRNAGDRVFAATMTAGSGALDLNGFAIGDSQLTLIGSDATVVEYDDDDGAQSAFASSIAGATLPTTGTYYLAVEQGSSLLLPYDLHFKLQRGEPAEEVEDNDEAVSAQQLPSAGLVAGGLSASDDIDFYVIDLDAGDTLFVSLDLDPERDGSSWNGAFGIGPFDGYLLLNSDLGGISLPDSEAGFQTVKSAGTYYIAVVSGDDAGFGDYLLSVSVHPAAAETANCQTYTSSAPPVNVPDLGAATATVTVPGHPRIPDLDVSLSVDHTYASDLDVQLTSPGGNTVGLFSDVADAADPTLEVTLDGEAALPISAFQTARDMIVQPEPSYRLSWFDGMDAGGTWTLTLRDDEAQDTGALTQFSITVCTPAAAPGCNGEEDTLFASDFEANNGGFTHAGTQDEWEYGTPTRAAFAGCHSGDGCWKTDLDADYELSSSQDLISPPIDLSGVPSAGGVRLSWAMRYAMETAAYDHASVSVRHVNDSNPRTLFEVLGPTMLEEVGSGPQMLEESAGWGVHQADLSDYAGSQIELVFHLDSDATVQLAGLAIDDVSVTSCSVGGSTCGNGVLESGRAVRSGREQWPGDRLLQRGLPLRARHQGLSRGGARVRRCRAVRWRGCLSERPARGRRFLRRPQPMHRERPLPAGRLHGRDASRVHGDRRLPYGRKCELATGTCTTPARPNGSPCGVAGARVAGVCNEPDEPPTNLPDGGAEVTPDASTDSGASSGDGDAGDSGTGTGDETDAGTGPDDDEDDDEDEGKPSGSSDEGCGCSVPGRPRDVPLGLWAALGMLGVWRRRR